MREIETLLRELKMYGNAGRDCALAAEDALAIAAALEAAREEAWQPIGTLPAMTHVLLMHPNYGGMGKPCMTWEFSGDARGFREDGYTHWHAAPKPPAIDQARGKGVADA